MAKKQSDYLASLLAEDEAEAEAPKSDTQDAAIPLPSRGEPTRASARAGAEAARGDTRPCAAYSAVAGALWSLS